MTSRDNNVNQFSYIRIPKALFSEPLLSELAIEAKVLYGYMLDRVSLSMKNGWLDEEGNAFIYFSLEETMESLNVGKNKAVKLMAALDSETGVGLIERVKQGQGKPAKIYVKNLAEMEEESEVYNSNLKTSQNQTSRLPENKPLEVSKSNPNKTDNNNTELINTSNLIESVDGELYRESDEMGLGQDYCVQVIDKNIEWTILIERNPHDRDIIEGIRDVLIETVLAKGKTMLIARNEYDMELIRRKMCRLDTSHIEYVLRSLINNTSNIGNIRKYMLAMLFNAPSTIGSYYQARVNHDMAQGVV